MTRIDTTALGAPGAESTARNTWQPLRYFTLYRLVLAGLMVVLFEKGDTTYPLGSYDLQLFRWTAWTYLGFALLCRFATERRTLPFRSQVYIQVFGDVIALTLLMHASGGIASGVGMLLVASVAGGSMLTGGRTAGLFAAVASIVLLLEQAYSHLYGLFQRFHYPQAGILGITLFATAALSHIFGRRVRESEALAERRGIDLANMAELTEYVLQQLDVGVVVVDHEGRIRLSNRAAKELLASPLNVDSPLAAICPQLSQRLGRWPQEEPSHRLLPAPFDSRALIPRFRRIGGSARSGTLIFLEDAEATERQAQQLKLAALGRLTASIAHEVRNPLGAISHARELLSESTLPAEDRRLVTIIGEHCQRLNKMVENILQLSRRKRPKPRAILLAEWLPEFISQFSACHGVAAEELALAPVPPLLRLQCDPSHLHQILTNLCQNGLRHAALGATPKVWLNAYAVAGRPVVYLEVGDSGTGISEETAQKLFEPFFTTAPGGTGLGLYLSRELAECNCGRLEQLASSKGALFRLSFPQAMQA